MAERTEKELQEGIDWIRNRPRVLHDLMIQFPPSCKVKATTKLLVPGPGKIGQVVSYVERKDGRPPMLRVRELPDGRIGAECEPGWLEVVEYVENFTPEFVKMALGRIDG
jgi:hypothetical protein